MDNPLAYALLLSLGLHAAAGVMPGKDQAKKPAERLVITLEKPQEAPKKAQVIPTPTLTKKTPQKSSKPVLATKSKNKPVAVSPKVEAKPVPVDIPARVHYELTRRAKEFPMGVMAYNGASLYWTEQYNICVDDMTANTELGQLFLARTTGKHLTPEGWQKYKPKYTQEQFERDMEYTRKLIREDKEFVIERTMQHLVKHQAAAEELLRAPLNLSHVDDETITKLRIAAKAMEVRNGGRNDILARRGEIAADLFVRVKGLEGKALEQRLFEDESARLLERAENSFYNAMMNKEAQNHLNEREAKCVPFADKARADFLKEAERYMAEKKGK